MNLLPWQTKHFYHRAGFGIGIPELSTDFRLKPSQLVEEGIQASLDLFDQDQIAETGSPIQDQSPFRSEYEPRMQRRETMTDQLDQLRGRWIDKMISTQHTIGEKMTLFWHGHFACQCPTENIAFPYLNVLRKHALGDFKSMLHSVAKSPAMIIFLNNLQNRKGYPNENFARELMELFTLGRGNYTERDVAESARAFTGWSADQQGNFLFRENNHDFGEKDFLGKRGPLDGHDVIDLILQQPETPFFQAGRLYGYFVNQHTNGMHVEKIAHEIKATDFDLAKVMHFILTQDFFYDQANLSNRIKSPIELLVQVARLFGLQYQNQKELSFLQKALGQLLFEPPNVSGWPGGRNWINNSTLMLRLNLVRYLLNQERFDHAVATPLEAMAAGESIQIVHISKDYSPLLDHFSGTRYDQLEEIIAKTLLATKKAPDIAKSRDFKDLDFTLQLILKTVSLPEFQMS